MTNANTNDALTVNRTFKSTLFIMLFEDKKNLLELYNAITGKHYADPELLEINTLENAIYMSMKNDVSFLIDGRLSLYEHQSTKNPNLPLRFLLYISHLYSRLTVKENLYGETIVQIPAPEFLIFYNGKDKMPERQILRLSDMYSVQEGQPKLELEATLLNISGSNNQKLKEACRTLGEYAIYTDKIRAYTEEMELSEAVDRAMDECIREDVLREFLMKHRAEARAMSIFEYDQERHMQQEREAGIEKGRRIGLAEGEEQLLRRLVQKNLSRGMSISEIAEVLDETEERIREIQSFNLLSDVFMSVALEDVPACQHILRILTGIDDLEVKVVRTQYTISRIKTHSVRLDALAETEKGKLYHIEIQRKDEIDPPKRIRYIGSLIDAEFLEKGAKYEELPDRIHFYISEKDIYHCGKVIYPVEKELGSTGLPYDDGVHIFFVNAAVDDGSRIAKLMKYFKTADPDDDSEGELSKRVRYLKREEGGVDIMCEVSEKIMEQGRKIGEEQGRKIGEEQGRKIGEERKAHSTALNLSRMGLTPEQIASAVGESLEQVKRWLVSDTGGVL